MKKITLAFFIIIATFVLFNTVVHAVEIDSAIYHIENKTNIDNDVGAIVKNALGVVQVIGLAFAIIMLIVLAIKYMTSAPNDRAEVKKHLVPYVIGAIFVFAASGIVEIIKQFAFTSINK